MGDKLLYRDRNEWLRMRLSAVPSPLCGGGLGRVDISRAVLVNDGPTY